MKSLSQAVYTAKSGVLEATDANGVPRLYAFESVGENPESQVR